MVCACVALTWHTFVQPFWIPGTSLEGKLAFCSVFSPPSASLLRFICPIHLQSPVLWKTEVAMVSVVLGHTLRLFVKNWGLNFTFPWSWIRFEFEGAVCRVRNWEVNVGNRRYDDLSLCCVQNANFNAIGHAENEMWTNSFTEFQILIWIIKIFEC